MVVHRQSFWTLLRCLIDTSGFEDVRNRCSSSKTPNYVREFFEIYGEKASNAIAVQELCTIVMASKSNISRLESLHATIRRSLMKSAVRTK